MLTTKVLFVMLLVDDYTGKSIESPAEARILVEESPCQLTQIIKPNGYRVFTGTGGSRFVLSVQSSIYTEQRMVVEVGKLNPGEPIFIGRMYRYVGVEPVSGLTAVRLKAVDDRGKPVISRRIGFLLNGNLRYLLLEEAKAGTDSIRMFSPEKTGIVGRKLIFQNDGAAVGVVITRQYSTSEFGLATLLRKDIPVDTKILVYHDILTDRNGEITCPFNLRKERLESVTVLCAGANGMVVREYQIEIGALNRLPDLVVETAADKSVPISESEAYWQELYDQF